MPEGTRSHRIDVGYLSELYILLYMEYIEYIYMEYKNTLIEFFSEREGFKKHMLCLEAEVTVQTAAPEPGMCIHSFLQPGVPQWQWLRITGQKT